MKNTKTCSVLALSTALLLSVCTTAGAAGSSSKAMAQDTLRTVQNMEQTLTESITSLTHSNADIAARMNATEQQMRTLVTLSEDNQRSIAQLQDSIDQLMRVLYQQQGRTPPRDGFDVLPPTPDEPVLPRQPTDPLQDPLISDPPVVAPVLPTVPNTKMNMDQHYRKAQEHLGQEEFSIALKLLDVHIARFPNSPHLSNATYWRAQCYFKLGDYLQAIKGYEQQRLQFPASEKVTASLYMEAVSYTHLGNQEKAKALLQQLIREYPDDANAEKARDGLRQLQGLGQ